ncbi:S1 RNA-binding domain-containing protein [Paenibacillus sp. PAMC21692]|jgi:predicted RNA-binding protein (virulence factor B family)|uniref:CvfB family protein n=1 Tax=Paenibacillus sp. PAMC21692 TaxID=2762320 RepID=UPI00164E38CA|nr:S1-like domain-containing RNA-binding protein [Paenibacillus sp. PAMC21692]QNK54399.1 RNA-binding protein [Paenibacillus sp. PAMC21692]
MTLTAGTRQTLRVAREVSPYGFFLSDGESEVLLHYTELIGSKPHIDDSVDVFIYYDSEDRIAATMKQSLLHLGELARLRVVDVHPRLGCFLEMGLSRHLLLPLSELPESIPYRPLPGDEVYVTMRHDKIGRLVAKTAFEEELSPLVFPAPATWKNSWVEGWVTKSLQMGSFVIVDGGVVGFGVYGLIPSPERTKALRLGERVRARVTFIREDGRVNLSMTERKEVGRVEDADRILAFLKERPGGAMPYSDETEAELIKKRFGISKSAFKRALGKLMREGIVTQKGSWTHLAAEQEESGAAGGATREEGTEGK